jgi:hypothetical protein
VNRYNALFLTQAWILALCGAGGYFFAHTAHIALVALTFNTLLVSGVIIGSDRHDRECPLMQESDS